MRHKIYITRARGNAASMHNRLMIKRAVNAALLTEKVSVSCELSVLLTDDEGIREINREFRHKDEPTDVLSFPANNMTAGVFKPAEMEQNPETGRIILGDMAISLERVRLQASELGHTEKRELQYLTIHSVLHLLGYDHVDEAEDKRLMREREKLAFAALTGGRK